MKYFIWKKLKFDINNSSVYPPKPATLLLAEIAIQKLKPKDKVLEVGTGSGAIAIAIAKFVNGTNVTATDINPEAIKVAKSNAKINRVQIKTVLGDFYKPFKDQQFDIIVVHPPAVPYPLKKTWGLTKGMTIATNGGPDGSELIVRSIIEAKRCLKSKGKLLLLLPHWCNTKKAYEALLDNYSGISKLAEKQVQFFPATEGNPTKAVLNYTLALAQKGVIELCFKNKKLYSRVSVIQANNE